MLNASIQDNRTTRPQGATRGGRRAKRGTINLLPRRSSEKFDKNRQIPVVHALKGSFDHVFKCSLFFCVNFQKFRQMFLNFYFLNENIFFN